MDWIYGIKALTLALCWINYLLNLYRTNWDFGSLTNVGWLMAVMGWSNAVGI